MLYFCFIYIKKEGIWDGSKATSSIIKATTRGKWTEMRQKAGRRKAMSCPHRRRAVSFCLTYYFSKQQVTRQIGHQNQGDDSSPTM